MADKLNTYRCSICETESTRPQIPSRTYQVGTMYMSACKHCSKLTRHKLIRSSCPTRIIIKANCCGNLISCDRKPNYSYLVGMSVEVICKQCDKNNNVNGVVVDLCV